MQVKKVLSIILAVGLIITNQVFVPPDENDLMHSTITASAAQYGKYFTYGVIDTDNDGQNDSVVITNCSQSEGSVLIPSRMNGLPVVRIGRLAFEECTGIESVIIPDSVISIGSEAFRGCASLESIAIPDNVISIESNAFRECTSLKNIVIPENVTNIGASAFQDCTALESVMIGKSVESIGDWAFYRCRKLTEVALPNSVISIGTRAFSDCNALKNVSIGEKCRNIGNYTFDNCDLLKEVTIPKSVLNIGTDAFRKCQLIYGYSGSEAQSYADKNGINFVSIGEVVTTTTQRTESSTTSTTTTSTSVTSAERELLYTDVIDRESAYEYSIEYVDVDEDDQNYNYNDTEFKSDNSTVTIEMIEHQNMRETVMCHWSDGSTTSYKKSLIGPAYPVNVTYQLSELNPEFEYISPAEVYVAFCPEMNEDIDAPVGFGFTFTAPTYSYGDGTLYAHGTISMHIAAPKEPVVTTTPITTTKITTKGTSTTTTTVSTTTHIISSEVAEPNVTCISVGQMYVKAIDQNYNYDDKEYNTYGTTAKIPMYKADNGKKIQLYWSDGAITYRLEGDFYQYDTLEYSCADLDPKYEYSSPAEAYKVLSTNMDKDIDADIGFSCHIKDQYMHYYNIDETYEGTIKMHFYAPGKTKGDVNLDGEFDIADVVLLQKWLLAVPDTELKHWENADFYEDGMLNVFDLCMMREQLIS